jgi:hypothetical protein
MAKVKELVDLTVSKEDHKLILKIVDRAVELGLTTNVLSSTMDITATHEVTPLRLKAFLEADDFNFRHDFCGIKNCIDRATGTMQKNFSPRFTRPDVVMGALINWCWNTKKHLDKAREIMTLRERTKDKKPRIGFPQWKQDVHALMRRMWLELKKAEPEFVASVGRPDMPTAEAFLDELP